MTIPSGGEIWPQDSMGDDRAGGKHSVVSVCLDLCRKFQPQSNIHPAPVASENKQRRHFGAIRREERKAGMEG